MTTPTLVVDASAFVDLLVGGPAAEALGEELAGHVLVVPAHFDAEVASALARLGRAGHLSERQVGDRIRRLVAAPLRRVELPALLPGAWRRRHNLRLVDAIYVELSDQLGGVPLVTTDGGLARAWAHARLVS